jgi:hypothetical protein
MAKRFKVTVPMTICFDVIVIADNEQQAVDRACKRMRRANDPLRVRAPKWVQSEIAGACRVEAEGRTNA